MDETDTPYLVVDESVALKNIERMAGRSRDLKKGLRPHSKTHKSPFWARQQIDYGANGLMVAKLSEAEVMVGHQLLDLSLGYPIIGKAKIERLQALVDKGARLRVSVDSMEGLLAIQTVGQQLGTPIETLIEVDTGMHRAGLLQPVDIVEMARAIEKAPGVMYAGITCFGGHVAQTLERDHIIWRLQEENQQLGLIRDLLTGVGLAPRIISEGGTIAAAFMEELTVATEVRPGTYIYNDATTVAAHGASIEECALTVTTMVVSKPDSGRIILDAGSKTLSSDGPVLGSYGIIKCHPELFISRLSEEHGIVESRDHGSIALSIGDLVQVVPNHACTTVNLHDRVVGWSSGTVRTIETVARGCVQ